ncbi:MAG: hypothetical protein J6Q11_09320 [Fibrobacteraceae bacterium]|nr:hypothetical protein [Fibrobacteraceae bacterium]
MSKKVKQESSSLWRQSIRAPLIVIVLLTTFALTILFYFSQDRNGEVYARYIETLSEYKYLDARLHLGMDRIRYNKGADSLAIEAGIMSLREIAVSVSTSIETFRAAGDWMPEYSQVDAFDREVLNKISITRRYLKERRQWLNECDAFIEKLWHSPLSNKAEIFNVLDSAKVGELPSLPEGVELSEDLYAELEQLLKTNREVARLWHRLDYSRASLFAEDLILSFKARELVMQERRAILSLIFYLFSLVMLLSTLLLYVRVKR